METGGSQTEQARAGIGSQGKVVRLPRDWLGPRDELVPIDLSDEAPAVVSTAEPPVVPLRGRADGPAGSCSEPAGPIPASAEAFWSEHATVLHDALCAPAGAGGDAGHEEGATAHHGHADRNAGTTAHHGHADRNAGTTAHHGHAGHAAETTPRFGRARQGAGTTVRADRARRPVWRAALSVAAAFVLAATGIARLVTGPGSRDAAGRVQDLAAAARDSPLSGTTGPGGTRAGFSAIVGHRPATGGSVAGFGVREAHTSGGRAGRGIRRPSEARRFRGSSDTRREAAVARRGHVATGASRRSSGSGGTVRRSTGDAPSRASATASDGSTRPAAGTSSGAASGVAGTYGAGAGGAGSTRGAAVAEAATSSPPASSFTPPAPDQNGLPVSGGPPPP